MKAVKIIVFGNVQGVFFRAYTHEEAERLELCGWVRNESNGDVAIHAEGNDENIDKFVSWCHEGSPMSSVEKVELQETEVMGYDGFEILE